MRSTHIPVNPMKLRHVALAALLVLVPRGAPAQSAAEAPTALCFQSRPASSCRVFLVTEVSRSSREYGAQQGPEHQAQWALGAMVNVTGSDAVGGTLVVGAPGSGQWGATGRYRRWLNEGFAIDVSPGVLVTGNDYDGRRLRLTADVSLNVGGWLGGFLHGESSRAGGQVGVGPRLGEWPGLIVGGLLYGYFSAIPET